MYDVLKSVISNGGYKLTELQRKIKKLFAMGDLSEAQTDDLLKMASGSISPDAERPELLLMIQSLGERIKALEDHLYGIDGMEEPAAYPQWKPWDGLTHDYLNGAVVSHNDKLWQSVLDGQNVWEPGAAGTEGLWMEYASAGQEG